MINPAPRVHSHHTIQDSNYAQEQNITRVLFALYNARSVKSHWSNYDHCSLLPDTSGHIIPLTPSVVYQETRFI